MVRVDEVVDDLLLWRSLVVVSALPMLGSTLSSSAMAVGGIGLVALVVVGILGALPAVGPYSPQLSPGELASRAVA